MLDGSSEHGAHIWSKSGSSICLRLSVTSKEPSNPSIYNVLGGSALGAPCSA